MPASIVKSVADVEPIRQGDDEARWADVNVSSLSLYGEEITARVAGAVLDGRVQRTIEGSPTIEVTLHDPAREFLRANRFANQKFDVKVNGVWWRLAAVEKTGDDLALTFEDRVVSWLRGYSDPRKSYRDQMTRFEFIVSLVDEVTEGKIPVYCPELHKIQPVAGGSSSGGTGGGQGTLGAGALRWTLRGKASTYGSTPYYYDPGDPPSATPASGIPNTVPGIATYNRSRLRGWWVVRAPNGRSAAVQQTDLGPSPSTGRVLDVNTSATKLFGYPYGNSFPTGQGEWLLYYVGQGDAAKRTAQALAAGQANGSGGTSTRQARQAQGAADAVRAPGFASGARITVKGATADAAQRRNIEAILSEGRRQGAPRRVLIASIMTATQESSIRVLTNAQSDGASSGIFQQTPGWGTASERMDPTASARMFFHEALRVNRANPNLKLTELCQKVQKSAFPNAYAQWESEATRTVDAWTGSGAADTSSAATTETRTARYAFERGQGGKRETTWDAAGRLCDEVGARRFVVANTLFLISEEDLYASRPRLTVSEALPWVDSVDFSIVMGRRAAGKNDPRNPSVGEVTVVGRSDRWLAPPGSTVELEEAGPADGRWLVVTTERGLFSRDATITLKKPIRELPEPAPETTTVTTPGASRTPGTASGDAGKVVEWLKSQVGYHEGPGNQNKYGPSDAWCGYFVQYALEKIAGLPISSSMGYVPHIREMIDAKAAPFAGAVSADAMEPGDVITWSGHTGFYIGGGRAISGNYSNGVREHGSTAPGAIVRAGRPRWSS